MRLSFFFLIFSPFYTMSIPMPASSRGPEFWDTSPFPVSRYVRKHASYLDASRFTNMCASDRALTVRDPRKCCEIPMLGSGLNVGCTVLEMACLCRIESVLRLIVPLFSGKHTSNMGRTFRRLSDALMSSRYPKLFHRL